MDVRNTESYKESHIEGAVNICINDIFQVDKVLKTPIDKPVVVYCGIGHVASQILTVLQLLGYDAIGLKYSMGVSTVAGEVQKGWVALGYPVMPCNGRISCCWELKILTIVTLSMRNYYATNDNVIDIALRSSMHGVMLPLMIIVELIVCVLYLG